VKPLRILSVHNSYQQAGGEDIVFAAERDLLRSYGHEVFEYMDTNDRLVSMSLVDAASNTIWSDSSYGALKKRVIETSPDIVHFHNTFMMISPSAYYACREVGVPVVQSLHNYRLACPSAIFFRDGKNCEDCLGKKIPWPGVLHGCYRGSRLQTLVVASMLGYHNLRETWMRQVNSFIVATHFSRDKMIAAGLPHDRIFIKPNFSISNQKKNSSLEKGYVFMSGRLSLDKGTNVVLRAWKDLENIPLRITGDGPLQNLVADFSQAHPALLNYYGRVSRAEVHGLLQGSRFVVFPTRMYEVFPMVIAEAFSYGVPAIASRLGAMEELIRDGETGLLFNPGDSLDLAEKVQWLWNRPMEAERMGRAAYAECREKYAPEKNYQLLMDIYAKTLVQAGNG
jgi:glycosyltransferase involved in cell wall biosynthesis